MNSLQCSVRAVSLSVSLCGWNVEICSEGGLFHQLAVTLGWQEKQCKLLWCVQPAAVLSIGVTLHKTSLNMLNRNSHYTGLHQVYLETLPNPDSSTSSPGRCLWGELLTHFLQYFCKLTLSGDRREEGEGGVCAEMTFYFLQTKNDVGGGQSARPSPEMCLFSLSFITVKIGNLPERESFQPLNIFSFKYILQLKTTVTSPQHFYIFLFYICCTISRSLINNGSGV